MKYRFFFISSHWPEAGEEALNSFLSQHSILTIEKEFVADANQPGWSFVVSYDDTARRQSKPSAKKTVDYREVLEPEAFLSFSRLRQLRKQLAEQQAVPPYTIFTNEQLAEIVRRQVQTLDELSLIEGIGPSRLARYGELFIQHLQPGEGNQDKGAG